MLTSLPSLRRAVPALTRPTPLPARPMTAAARRYAQWREGVDFARQMAADHRAYWETGYWTGRPTSGAFRLAVIGDSAAQAVGVPDPADGWVCGIEQRLAELTGRPIVTHNLSVSGATSADLVQDQLPRLASLTDTPDLVICEVGGNDMIRKRFSSTRFRESLATIAEAIPAVGVISEVPSFGHGPMERRVISANTVVRQITAAFGHERAELYGATRLPHLRDYLPLLSGDLFHPNAAGYERWTDAIWTAVEQVVSQRAQAHAAAG